MVGTKISPIEEIIDEARNGRPFVLVDAPDRENEGDIVIPAQFATPDVINFMAKHARGLICLSITRARADQLGLGPMVARNESGHGTAFTVSIEAREGVTTGISAHDRARTIAVALDPGRSSDDIVTPGHVFPLVAREGGVLVRAGHTEAAVDIARLAGLMSAGVICEIMNADGSMSRLPELQKFAELHNLKIGTISDLIAYRLKSESLIERIADTAFPSHFGEGFRAIVYRDKIDGVEHVALVKGHVDPSAPTLVRVHLLDLAADLLGWKETKRDYARAAIEMLAAHEGAAVGVFVRDPSPTGFSERIGGGPEAYISYAANFAFRDYGIGAQILRDIGVRDMILLTSSHGKPLALEGFGLSVVERRPIPDRG